MQTVSGVGSGHLQPMAGVEKPTAARQEAPAAAEPTPVPAAEFGHVQPESPGRYWKGSQEGRAAVLFDPPTTRPSGAAAEAPQDSGEHPNARPAERSDPPDEPEGPAEEPDKRERRMRCSTDAVDREIEQLRRKVHELEQQAAAAGDDPGAARELEAARRELASKDNDTYRRQNAQFLDLG